jgi:hypothetical protein
MSRRESGIAGLIGQRGAFPEYRPHQNRVNTEASRTSAGGWRRCIFKFSVTVMLARTSSAIVSEQISEGPRTAQNRLVCKAAELIENARTGKACAGPRAQIRSRRILIRPQTERVNEATPQP